MPDTFQHLDNAYTSIHTCSEGFYLADRFHGSTLHGARCTAGGEAHTNFADESACLTSDNVRNEVVIIHRSQKALKILSL
jgi:hypothetical protein